MSDWSKLWSLINRNRWSLVLPRSTLYSTSASWNTTESVPLALQRVSHDLVRAVRRVAAAVKERAVVAGPLQGVVDLRDAVAEHGAARQVLHHQQIALGSGRVDRERQHALVRAHATHTDPEVRPPRPRAGSVLIEHHFLRGGERAALAAEDGVLLPGDRPGVVVEIGRASCRERV